MLIPRRAEFYLLVLLGVCVPVSVWGQAVSSVRRVQILGSSSAVEIEVEASDRLVPQTQVLTGPDRLVVDFPNAIPGAQLRSQAVNRGEVKSVRVGLFQSNPPITRVVLDLNAPQSYQVFPNGRTVIIKVMGNTAPIANEVDDFPSVARPGLVNTGFAAKRLELQTGPQTRPSLEVSFHDGLLAIRANKTSLSEVLFAVHQRTGAEIAVAAGAEQEQVVADIGPAPAAEVLARLLTGSRFNFLILSSENDPRGLDRVILSARTEGGVTALQPLQNDEPADEEGTQNVEPTPAANVTPPQGRELPPRTPPEMNPPVESDSPE